MDTGFFSQLVVIGPQLIFVFLIGLVVKYEFSLLGYIIEELRDIKEIIKEKSGQIISIYPNSDSDEGLDDNILSVSLGDICYPLTSSSETDKFSSSSETDKFSSSSETDKFSSSSETDKFSSSSETDKFSSSSETDKFSSSSETDKFSIYEYERERCLNCGILFD